MSAVQYAYLGKAGNMKQLPIPRRGTERSASMGDAAHGLLSGGTAVVRNLNAKTLFTLPYDVIDADSQVILGFYRGIYGIGPWRFVDPTVRNVLPLDASVCGARTQADDGWVPSTGSLAVATTGAPAGVDSAVITWSSLAAAATLQPGTVANTADVTTAPVYVPAEAVTVSLYAKANASSSGHSLQLVGYNAAGAATVTSSTTAMALTTSFQRFSVTIAANAAAYASAIYVLPRIVLGGTAPTSVSIAGAQVEYGDAVTTWQPGYGCPVVVIRETPGRTITAPGWRGHNLVLAEV